jgi:RNA polymerase sigma factor (sigma-70 family)
VHRYLAVAPKLGVAMRHLISADKDEAVDIIQELLVIFLERIEDSDTPLLVEELGNDELLRYLARTVRNYWIDHKRRAEIIRRNYEQLVQGLEAESPTPEALLVESEHHELVRQSVAALEAPHRKLLQALLDEDATLAEIARKRKIKRGTIYTQFRRALEALRGEWDRRTRTRLGAKGSG